MRQPLEPSLRNCLGTNPSVFPSDDFTFCLSLLNVLIELMNLGS
jgi:hypothetical protein